jgi:membrane associated rhomboid family serine protease
MSGTRTGAPSHRPMPRGLLALVGLIAAIEVVLSAADAGIVADPTLRSRVLLSGAFWAALLYGAQPIFALQPLTMFVTHALLHGSLLHMVMNMAILLALGRFVSDRYGSAPVLPLFVVGAIAGGAVFGLLTAGSYPMVGASGAVFCFLGIWIVWDWRRHKAHGVSTGPVLRRVVVLAGLNVFLYVGLQGMLAWEAHLGGFLAGLACGAWLESRVARHDRMARAELRRRRLDEEPPDD